MVTVLLSDGYFASQEVNFFNTCKAQFVWGGYDIVIPNETARILKILDSIKYKPVNIKINDNGQLFCDIVRVVNYKMTSLGFALKRFHTKHDNQAVIDLLRKHGAKK